VLTLIKTAIVSLNQKRSKGKLRRHLVGKLHNFLSKILPYNRTGDTIIYFIDFCLVHMRMPKKQLTFNDVIHNIKATDEIINPLRVFVSDKEFVKTYVKAIVGDQYNVPTIAVLRSMDEVRKFNFPPACCIKATHAAGTVILRKEGEEIDFTKIANWFHINYYHVWREANYKTLKPKVIVEPLIFNDINVEDYKVFCFNGVPKLIQVDVDRYIDHRRKFFDSKWNEQHLSMIKYEIPSRPIKCPNNLQEMLSVAAALSSAFSFVRIDLYSDGETCFVGEITNCAENAFGRFSTFNAEYEVSKLIFK